MSTKGDMPTVAVSLTVKSAADALDFYARALGAQELYRMPVPGGGVAHAEFMVGNTRMYISDESDDYHAQAMPEGAKASCLFAVMVENSDDAFKKAVDAGGEPLFEPTDQFWGTRTAMIRDPYGYRWALNQVIEEVSPEEIMERAQKLFAGGG